MVQVHVTPRGGERCSLVPNGTTFALGPAVLARGDDPPDPPVPGFARPVAETAGADWVCFSLHLLQSAGHNLRLRPPVPGPRLRPCPAPAPNPPGPRLGSPNPPGPRPPASSTSPVPFPWWIQAWWWIRCIPVPRTNRKARIDHNLSRGRGYGLTGLLGAWVGWGLVGCWNLLVACLRPGCECHRGGGFLAVKIKILLVVVAGLGAFAVWRKVQADRAELDLWNEATAADED